MALFNITNFPGVVDNCDEIPFKASNNNIKVSTETYRISELTIYYCSNDNLINFKTSNNNIKVSNELIEISQLQIPN